MRQQISQPYRLIQIFAPIWAEAHGGVEYEADGRDWREARVFLEIHPEFLKSEGRLETFKQRAWEYMGEDFYNQPYASPPLNHQLFFFLKNYASYGRTKLQPTAQQKKVQMIACSDCDTVHNPNDLCPKCYPEVTGDRQSAMKAIKGLTEHFKQGDRQ